VRSLDSVKGVTFSGRLPTLGTVRTSRARAVETRQLNRETVQHMHRRPRTTHDETSRRAYEIFEARGRQHGHDDRQWLSCGPGTSTGLQTEVWVQQRRSRWHERLGVPIPIAGLLSGILAPPRGAAVTARSIARSMVLVYVLAVVLAARPNAVAQRQGPQPVPDPAQGDGGVSAFYTWDEQVPATPGRLLRQSACSRLDWS